MDQLNLEHKGEKLFEQISCVGQLKVAYKAVRANKGAPGIDDVSVEDYGRELEEELSKLSEEVREWTYRPNPVKRVRIPKPGKRNEERLLGIPCVRDRVLQYSLKMTLEELFLGGFSKHSYGFMPGRCQRDAVLAAKELVKSGKEWVVDMDLEKFFDRINHDRIIHLLRRKVSDKRVLRLVGQILRCGIMDNGKLIPNREGAVQGSPLSPLLSNIVLDEFDKELEKRDLAFCRYADDCNIFVRSEKAGRRVMESLTRFIESKLKLKVNQTKSQVALSKTVKFLGMTIYGGMIVIATKSKERGMEMVKALTPRGTHVPLEQQIERINRWYMGWSGYFEMTEMPSQLKAIESYTRRRLRAQLVGAQKRKRYLLRKLIKLGAKPSRAKSTIYSNRGRWRLSHTRVVEKAWSRNWLERRGLETVSQEERPHWKPLDLWFKTS